MLNGSEILRPVGALIGPLLLCLIRAQYMVKHFDTAKAFYDAIFILPALAGGMRHVYIHGYQGWLSDFGAVPQSIYILQTRPIKMPRQLGWAKRRFPALLRTAVSH